MPPPPRARKVTGRDQHALLRSTVTTATGEPHAVVALPRVDDPGLVHVMGRLLADGSEDVAEGELREALDQAGHALSVPMAPSPGTTGDQQPVEEWEGFPVADGLAALQCAVRTAPDQALRRVVELVTATGAALLLAEMAVPYPARPTWPDILRMDPAGATSFLC